MEPETIKLINELAKLLANNSSYATEQYALWYATSAFCWIVFGAGLVLAAIRFPKPENWEAVPTQVVRIVGFLIGAMILAANIPDLLNPTAISIHQLITDIKR